MGTGAILLGAFVFLLIALLIGTSRLDEQRRLLKGFDLEDVARIELAAEDDPATTMDADAYRIFVEMALERISRKIKLEKQKVALLLYATAQDVPITEAVVLEGLGIGKSRAYAIREKAMKVLRKELEDFDGAAEPLFVRILLDACEAALPESVRTTRGGAQ